MGLIPRLDVGGVVFHVLNRANNRSLMFEQPGDYLAFETMLEEAKQRVPIELFAYCIMPNHWHLVVRALRDGTLSTFMHWLTLSHSKRWRAFRETTGYGHLYQGPYKSFPVQDDRYFLSVCRYVERNPLRANLVNRAEEWRWSSLWRMVHGDDQQRRLIDPRPIRPTSDYVEWVNAPQTQEEIDAIRQSVRRGSPYGDAVWVRGTADRLGLAATLHPRGRPRKE